MFWWWIIPRSGGFSPGDGGMPIHDAVGVNFENGATTEIQDTRA